MPYFLFAESVQRNGRPEVPLHKDEPAPFVVRPIARRAAPVPAAGAEESSPDCRPRHLSANIKKPRTRQHQTQPHAPNRDAGSAAARRVAHTDTGADVGLYSAIRLACESTVPMWMSTDVSDDGGTCFGNDDGTFSDQMGDQRDKKNAAPDLHSAAFYSAAGTSMDVASWADILAPSAGDDGIFELLLPNGETMGVVVHAQPALVSFLLSLSSETSSKLLRSQQMELERHLERRIQRNVKITFL